MKGPRSVAIVDSGVSNVGSVVNLLEHIGQTYEIINDGRRSIENEVVILPGLGHFGHAMNNLKLRGLVERLNECKIRGNLIIGICLGMQLMGRTSEEGGAEGLGWLPFDVRRFPDLAADQTPLLIPQMGWNRVEVNAANPASYMFLPESRFYFVHSYYVPPLPDVPILSISRYGGIPYCAAFAKDNVIGFQFHPEKSHKFGMHLLEQTIKSRIHA